jgi:hypothetical protein
MIPHGHALAALNLGSVMNRKVCCILAFYCYRDTNR